MSLNRPALIVALLLVITVIGFRGLAAQQASDPAQHRPLDSQTPPTQPAAERDRQKAYELVRTHKHGEAASVEVLAAARLAFDVCHLYGLSRPEVEKLLGPPANSGEIEGRPWIGYAFSDGRVSVLRQLWFDGTGKLFGVEALPTA